MVQRVEMNLALPDALVTSIELETTINRVCEGLHGQEAGLQFYRPVWFTPRDGFNTRRPGCPEPASRGIGEGYSGVDGAAGG